MARLAVASGVTKLGHGSVVWLGLVAAACSTTSKTPDTPQDCPACPLCLDDSSETPPTLAEALAAREEVDEPDEEPEDEADFTPAPTLWNRPDVRVRRKQKGCSVSVIVDPEVTVLYRTIDVYTTLAGALPLRPSLPQRATRALCPGGCSADAPNPIVVEDGESGPIDGRAIGFVIPIGDGFWVRHEGEFYREQHCMPEIDAEVIAEDHARLSVQHMEVFENDCDSVGPDEPCGIACFYAGVTRYDLVYTAEDPRALLVTRDYAALDADGEPKPKIELVRTQDTVRVSGCGVDEAIPWPP